MSDFGDLFSPAGTEGTRWMRIVTGLVGAVFGGGIGILVGSLYIQTELATASYGIIGAFVGGGLGALFSGLVMVMLVATFAMACVFAWQYFVGDV